MEKKTHKLIPYKVDYICDECKEGAMRPTNISTSIEEEKKHIHECQSCGAKASLPKRYPAIEFIEIPITEEDDICSECNAGILEFTGIVFDIYPQKYEHKCSNCGSLKNLNKIVNNPKGFTFMR